MNSNNTPTLLEISYYMLGCNKKVKEICVPKYTHLINNCNDIFFNYSLQFQTKY